MSHALLVFNYAVLAFFLLVNTVYTVLLVIAFPEAGRHTRRLSFGGYDAILRSPLTLPISVLMPAYNEEETIVEAVNSLRLLEYGEYEIVVIDDGSTDGTLQRLRDAFALEQIERPLRLTVPCNQVRGIYVSRQAPNLTVLSKANGGKADALNAGLNAARYPLFCAIDADALLARDALLRVVKPFMERPRETLASSGIVRVANGCEILDGRVVRVHLPSNRLARLQVVEYLRAFLGTRTAWSRLHSLFVISGAFGVFKKQAVLDAGGYRTDTVGEDMDLVLRLHRQARERGERYRIVFIPDPVVWTEVPESLRVLRRQRNRWHRGLLECLAYNRGMLFRPRCGPIGMLGLPYNLLIEVAGPLIEVSGYVALVVAVATGGVNGWYFALFFLLAVGYGMLLSVASLLLDDLQAADPSRRRDILALLAAAIVENLGYRQLQAFWRVQASVDFLRKKGGWGEMRRTGFHVADSGTKMGAD